MSKAKIFFNTEVTESYNEWLSSTASKLKAKTLAIFLNSLIDYYWNDLKTINTLNAQFPTDKKFRAQLCEAEPDLAIVRDIADGTKHFELCRKNRQLDTIEQVKQTSIGYGDVYGVKYGGGDILAVELNDATRVYVPPLLSRAYDYWKARIENEYPD